MSWSALFDRTHILKGVPVDADIELQCRKCKTFFRTRNAYYIGYSDINYADPQKEKNCTHNLEDLKPTNKWFPLREIHKQAGDPAWASLFDYSHILEGVPVDAYIELQCKTCNTNLYTINAYYIGYAEIFYASPEEQGRCKHDLKELRPTKRWQNKLN